MYELRTSAAPFRHIFVNKRLQTYDPVAFTNFKSSRSRNISAKMALFAIELKQPFWPILVHHYVSVRQVGQGIVKRQNAG